MDGLSTTSMARDDARLFRNAFDVTISRLRTNVPELNRSHLARRQVAINPDYDIAEEVLGNRFKIAGGRAGFLASHWRTSGCVRGGSPH